MKSTLFAEEMIFFFKSYGVSFDIRVNKPGFSESILDRLPPGSEFNSSSSAKEIYSLIVDETITDSKQNQIYQLYRDDEQLIQTTEFENVLNKLDSDLSLRVGMLTPDKLFVHAGVVSWQGKAIIIPGRSFSGKTTLTAALVEAGATYYSDEYAVFDAQGLVHPYPRKLALRQENGLRKKRCSVEELGGKPGVEPIPVGWIFHIQYQRGAYWQPQPTTPGEAVLALLDNTIVARTRPALAMSILPSVVANALSFQGKRGEATEVARVLLSQL